MPADAGRRSALAQVQADLAGLCKVLANVVAGARGSALIDDLRATVGGTTPEILWRALFADCLRVVHSAVMADGTMADSEIEGLYEIVAAAASHYAAGPRSQYAEFVAIDHESARAFLDRYAADRGPLGQGARLRWPGLTLCRRAAELGERDAVTRYAKAMTAMIAEACRIGGVAENDAQRDGLHADEIAELRRNLAAEATATKDGTDRRIKAFLAPCRVFSAVQHASSIFENDPFDVEDVHRDARASFAQLVEQATMRPYIPDLGRMLLVLGDSGAGKTHLLRGFRRHVQEGNRGFVLYAQLQSRSEDYSRYLLWHLVTSLSQRYSEQSGSTGLRELAGGLIRLAGPALRVRLEQLASDTWDARGNLTEHVEDLVNELVHISELASFDVDLLRVLLYALCPHRRTTLSVYKYLRCDPMNDHDRRWIGDVAARTRDDDPHWMIHDLARFAAVTRRALVIMVDQVELTGFEAQSTAIFQRAIDALYRIVSECPGAVAVVACLSDLYDTVKPRLNRSALDRLENSPPPARLQTSRSYAEIKAVVARRLSWLFAEHGTVHRPEQPVYPIPEVELRQLENRRLRDVLEWCHQFQTQCALSGKIINADEPVCVTTRGREPDLDQIAVAWSEAIQAADLEMPDETEEILAVVAEAANAYVHELGLSLNAPPHKNGVLRLKMSRGDDCAELVIAVVNQSFHGGAFTSRIELLRKRAKGAVPIAVRTLEFPRGRACDKAMGQLVNMRGRGAYLDASTLRTLVALQRFQPSFAAERISAWRLRDRPISSLPAVIEIFDFDRSRVERLVAGERRPRRAASEPAAPDPELVNMEPARSEPDDVNEASPDDSRPASGIRGNRFMWSAGDIVMVHKADGGDGDIHAADAVASDIGAAPGNPAVATAKWASNRGRKAAGEAATSSRDSAIKCAAPARGAPAEITAAHGAPPEITRSSGALAAEASATARAITPEPSLPIIPPPKKSTGRAAPAAAAPGRQLRIGNSTSFDSPEPIGIEPAALLRHVAIVDGVGSGRVAAVLNLVEQVVERGVPAIVLDRTGEMTGYARPDWWQHSADPARARQLAERIEVRLFTPGSRGGRPLSVAMIPELLRVPRAEHERAVQLAAVAVAAMLPPGPGSADAGRLAALTQAIGLLARRSSPAGLVELIALVEGGADDGGAGSDAALRQRLVNDLAALMGNAEVFSPGAEPLTAATLVGPGAGGRVPLAIVHTGFLGDGARLRTWMAQLIGALDRELAATAGKALHTVVVFDGAELLLPAGAGKASAKEPLQELLQRAGNAGVGLVLASPRPGELDYRRCASIETWLVGKTDEATLERMKPLLDRRPLGHRNPSRLEPGRSVMLHDGGARDVERAPPLLRVERLGDAELKALAARTHPRARDAPAARRADPAGEEQAPLPQQPR